MNPDWQYNPASCGWCGSAPRTVGPYCEDCEQSRLTPHSSIIEHKRSQASEKIMIGTTVQILVGEHKGTPGRVYAHVPGLAHEWLVRPCSWPENEPGIAFGLNEIITRKREAQP